jgi:catechol 2,3-dioxygenase-like lactoylglutathione lyase family enzyme
MVVGPWKITDYKGTGVARPAMDHLGFTVESIDAFSRDMEQLAKANTALTSQSLTATPENVNRLELLKQCPLGHLHLTDPDGVLLEVSEPG